jgi:hypothetical protein
MDGKEQDGMTFEQLMEQQAWDTALKCCSHIPHSLGIRPSDFYETILEALKDAHKHGMQQGIRDCSL